MRSVGSEFLSQETVPEPKRYGGYRSFFRREQRALAVLLRQKSVHGMNRKRTRTAQTINQRMTPTRKEIIF